MNQKKQIYPFRKQFTMPKRLPSTNYDNMLEDVLPNNSDSINLSNQDFTEEELRLLEGGEKFL